MANWKNLRDNPPTEDCNVCVKVGDSFDTYKFRRYSKSGYDLYKYPRRFDMVKIPKDAMYINLDEIK